MPRSNGEGRRGDLSLDSTRLASSANPMATLKSHMPRQPAIKASKPHDTGYKRLFSHPELVEGLIKVFIADPWLQALNFSTLERLPNSYITF